MPNNMKTKINKKPVASTYESARETIVEFWNPHAQIGGLIAFTLLDDGRLLVEPYRLDSKVVVRPPQATFYGTE